MAIQRLCLANRGQIGAIIAVCDVYQSIEIEMQVRVSTAATVHYIIHSS